MTDTTIDDVEHVLNDLLGPSDEPVVDRITQFVAQAGTSALILIDERDRARRRADWIRRAFGRAWRDRFEYESLFNTYLSLMTRTTIALKGEPRPLHNHNFADVPDVAAAKMAEIARLSDQLDQARRDLQTVGMRAAHEAEQRGRLEAQVVRLKEFAEDEILDRVSQQLGTDLKRQISDE